MSEYNIQINKYDALNAGYDQLYPKPMKHANTHASGGTDPITPSDIGAYSKNETDALLAKKADLGEDGKVPTAQLPPMDYAPAYTYGTEDMTAGTSPLETGKLYFVYE